MKIFLKINDQEEKLIQFMNNNNQIYNDYNKYYKIEWINVEHSCNINDIVNIKTPNIPYLKYNNQLIQCMYSLLYYFINQFHLLNEYKFEIRFVNENKSENLEIIFDKLFEKNIQNEHNIQYHIILSYRLLLDNFNNGIDQRSYCNKINELNGLDSSLIININYNNINYYTFSDIIITKLNEIITKLDHSRI